MYNLFVSGGENVWESSMWTMDRSRCIREYTSEDLVNRFGSFSESAIEALKTFPCVFAYEQFGGQPRFGYLRNIRRRSESITVEIDYIPLQPWIDVHQLHAIQGHLDIMSLELYRTHWAIKDIDLNEELSQLGVTIPAKILLAPPIVNPDQHQFKVAFSFPGELRPLVQRVFTELVKYIDPNDIFYDFYFQAFLARPNLGLMLQRVYRDQAKLIVVFLSGHYQQKPWPWFEFRTVQEIILNQQYYRIMYIKTDHIAIDGVLSTDGYIDANIYSPKDLANLIYQRVAAQ